MPVRASPLSMPFSVRRVVYIDSIVSFQCIRTHVFDVTSRNTVIVITVPHGMLEERGKDTNMLFLFISHGINPYYPHHHSKIYVRDREHFCRQRQKRGVYATTQPHTQRCRCPGTLQDDHSFLLPRSKG